MRLQAAIVTMDKEFKLFMKNKGLSIDASLFDLKFVEPRALVNTKKLKYMLEPTCLWT